MATLPDSDARLESFRARSQRYAERGYDRFDAARFIIRTAGGLISPALDIGTGKGLCALELAQAGLEVVSVDPDADEQALAALLAREAGVRHLIEFVRGDSVFLGYPDGYFGCAFMVDVLHHLSQPVPVLREIARAVRKDGLVVLADFDEQGFALLAEVHVEEGREHHRTTTTLLGAMAELEAHGFQRLGTKSGYLHEVAVLIKDR